MSKISKKISSNKNAKKPTKTQESVLSNNELKNLLKIILIVCGVLLVFYFITVLVQNKDKSSDNNSDTTAVIQYDKILVGQILNQNEDNYFVLAEEKNDPYVDLYKQYLNNVDDVTYYTVDLSDVFNQNYIGEEILIEGNEVEKYKFSETVLINVSDGMLNGVFKGKEEIIQKLKNL